LIIYYFLEIEGERGVAKIRKFLEKNRAKMKIYEKYCEDFKQYQSEWAAFTKLPGVTSLDNGRIEYPSHLIPPTPPSQPFNDPSELKLTGLNELLDGESPEALGEKIEQALVKELGINFQFKEL
jgi:hypothetical protein